MIDLHVHSVYSDGSCSPRELVGLGSAAGLTAMVLTDHDTLEGVPFFQEAAEACGMRTFSGVELSLDIPGGSVHMLAYGVDPEQAAFNAALERVRTGRRRRNTEILSRLSRLGCHVTWPDVLACAGDAGVVGRPHFAQALQRKGCVRSKMDAFSRYLGRGAPAYVERDRLTPDEAIPLIHEAGGVSVLAHPSLYGMEGDTLSAFVAGLAGIGLGGLEVYYSGHNRHQVAEYLSLADSLGLLATGGSDFHGAVTPNVQPGVGTGTLEVPDACFDALLDCLGQTAVRPDAPHPPTPSEKGRA